ncbi:MAG: phytanoyl-CoA dioxygenase family protein [Planctomycetes bacterium]|nr:phytanoyl-CoA dioxygenase family protein [Planctomycetota bacterium]
MDKRTLDALERDGYALLRGVYGRACIEALAARLEALAESQRAGSKGEEKDEKAAAGVRVPRETFPEAAELLAAPTLAPVLAAALGGGVTLVRVLLFDKNADAPWKVRWHRDTMIPVDRHRSEATLSGHSVKAGVPHVRATAEILARMLAVRIHIDASTAENGPLEVLPGSHCVTKLDAAPSAADFGLEKKAVCCAEPGDVLLMRPLLLHGSPKPATDARRRVLHLECSGPQELPDGYQFHGA